MNIYLIIKFQCNKINQTTSFQSKLSDKLSQLQGTSNEKGQNKIKTGNK